jgi:hypothetical protein
MLSGLVAFVTIGTRSSYSSLMPAFLLYGLGAGLMTPPLTTAVLAATPPERGGVASALMNDSREVAGLLGITVIGAVLRSVDASALRNHTPSPQAFLDGYHAGLYVTIAVVAVCVVVGYLSLRPQSTSADAGRPLVGAEVPSVALDVAGREVS